jgi:hypothetical protein
VIGASSQWIGLERGRLRQAADQDSQFGEPNSNLVKNAVAKLTSLGVRLTNLGRRYSEDPSAVAPERKNMKTESVTVEKIAELNTRIDELRKRRIAATSPLKGPIR